MKYRLVVLEEITTQSTIIIIYLIVKPKRLSTVTLGNNTLLTNRDKTSWKQINLRNNSYMTTHMI